MIETTEVQTGLGRIRLSAEEGRIVGAEWRAENLRAALGREAQCFAGAQRFGAVRDALQQHSLPRLRHEIGGVVRG